jgi:hypothetical protein
MNRSIQSAIRDGVLPRLMATVAEFADDTKSVTAQMEKHVARTQSRKVKELKSAITFERDKTWNYKI